MKGEAPGNLTEDSGAAPSQREPLPPGMDQEETLAEIPPPPELPSTAGTELLPALVNWRGLSGENGVESAHKQTEDALACCSPKALQKAGTRLAAEPPTRPEGWFWVCLGK